MRIQPFAAEHAEPAALLALRNYEDVRQYVPALPPVAAWPDLTGFAANGMGVAALDGDELLGFLCAVPPFGNAFRSTDAIGVFSPMHANGAIQKDRAHIYARMIEEAGAIWAQAGASSHAVCLYAYDCEGQQQFFRYGYGLRCIDAIRYIKEIDACPCEGFDFCELPIEGHARVLPLVHLLDGHMAASPTFILRASATEASFLEDIAESRSRLFVAQINGQIAAFIRAQPEGETFVCDMPGYLHVTGAFCLPEYRGKSIYQGLFNHLLCTLKAEGYTRLGVDFESLNPAAHGFWLKYFDAYTYGLVRRVDEHVLTR
ncbi:MAG: GNAT family N-acetyltransferase [Clostridia bacterium]|nr:GNAT family N-acetyltransferase [Clostridia bacterium]